jgi:drug/metabolite transporter (DMT)-like permease
LTRSRAIAELLLAGAIWGFGFTANEVALREMQTLDILLYRFIFAVIAGEMMRALFFRSSAPLNKSDMIKAIPAGVILSGMLILQTVGMEYTTATNSGFLTILYVILVPLFNHIFFKIKTPLKVYGMAALALAGAFMLMGRSISNLNKGDVLTILCAIIAAVHIIYLGKVSRHVKDVVRFNNWQSFFCLVPIIPFWFIYKKPITGTSLLTWASVVYLAIGSSAIAFCLQVRAQKILSDMTASMLFLLESPFAFLFAFLLLGERLGFLEAMGAVIILISSALTILWDSPGYSKPVS